MQSKNQRKLTKRERKQKNGPNAMVQRSLKYGKLVKIGDRYYRGNRAKGLPLVLAEHGLGGMK